ncbi:acyl-CoA--6-aminopenicillanic acid acyltransferase [Pseudonocardia acaciae]|uniref:acyl-CoA--6-aminopenicillanic acid acyltransferase n=1 Tax=Pseudonocardia acaciae TaxID=551276 RepID=UPI000565D2D4|nr:acyl-CoA--6-aminopenicillanic acid acyltransferase [Pseudonocardia acaciae]
MAISLIELRGTPRERGRHYGEAAGPRVRASIDYYAAAFARSSGLDWPEVMARARRWLPLVEDFAPDLVEEMAGVAEGAGVDPLEVLALNARGEIVYDHTFARIDPAPDCGSSAECTSLALLPPAAGDGHVYAAQNWDWRAEAVNWTVMLRIVQPPKPTVIMQVEAGQIGRHGANSAGIALNANGLGGRFDNAIGIPQAFIRRRILDSDRFSDALDVPFRVRQQIAANLLLTHRDGVSIDLETTPARHRWLYPDDGLLVHANHYQAGVPSQLADSYRPFAVDSLYRTEVLRGRLRACVGEPDPDAVRKLIGDGLSDHFGHPDSVCSHPDPREDPLLRSQTIVSSIVDLTTGAYFVSDGTPCDDGYTRLPWGLYDEPGEQAV